MAEKYLCLEVPVASKRRLGRRGGSRGEWWWWQPAMGDGEMREERLAGAG